MSQGTYDLTNADLSVPIACADCLKQTGSRLITAVVYLPTGELLAVCERHAKVVGKLAIHREDYITMVNFKRTVQESKIVKPTAVDRAVVDHTKKRAN